MLWVMNPQIVDLKLNVFLPFKRVTRILMKTHWAHEDVDEDMHIDIYQSYVDEGVTT